MNGFINVLKPTGLTSSDVVVKIKRILNTKKVGHTGTLDPGGSGVLPVAVGKSTRLFDFYLTKSKVYRASICFGVKTDTLDSYGKIIAKNDKTPTKTELTEVLKKFVGEIEQTPPSYSAININGVRAYDLARKGVEFEIATRKINIYSLDFIAQTSENTFLIDVCCSGGTYIRSLCDDIASALGTVAYMSSIIRLRSGNFDISNSFTLQEIEAKVKAGESVITSPQDVLSELGDYEVTASKYEILLNGIKVRAKFEGTRKIYCKGELFGLGVCEDEYLKITVYLRD